MTDTITLPRAVGERLRNVLRELASEYPPKTGLISPEERTALAALDAALAEPEKKRAETGIPARGDAGAEKSAAQQENEAYRTPEPDAKREPATVEHIDDEYIRPVIDARWHDFEAGFRAAERFHGIRKEDK